MYIDYNQIEKLRVCLSNYFELRNAALCVNSDISSASLEVLASKYLDLKLNKTCCNKDFYCIIYLKIYNDILLYILLSLNN